MRVQKSVLVLGNSNTRLQLATVSDDLLLRRIEMQRDRRAFRELFCRYQQHIINFARRLTVTPAIAEEAVQDAMMDVWSGSGRFRGGDAKKWLFGVVARKCLATRKRIREHAISDWQLENSPENENSSNAESSKKEEAIIELRIQIKALPKEEQQIIALYYFCEMSQDQISNALNIPQRTISARLKRILDNLQSRMQIAGFSVSIPLLTQSDWTDALSDVSLSNETVHFICNDIATNDSISTSSTAGIFSSFFLYGIPVAAALIIAGSTVNNEISSPITEVPPLNLFKKSWTFENGLPKEFTPIAGDYDIWPGSDKQPAKLAGSPEHPISFYLPQNYSFGRPVRLTVKGKGFENNLPVGNSIFRAKENKPSRYELYLNNTDLPMGKLITFRSYVYKNRIAVFHNSSLFSMKLYEKPEPTDRFYFHLQNLEVESITFQEISASELPKVLKVPENKLHNYFTIEKSQNGTVPPPSPENYKKHFGRHLHWDFTYKNSASFTIFGAEGKTLHTDKKPFDTFMTTTSGRKLWQWQPIGLGPEGGIVPISQTEKNFNVPFKISIKLAHIQVIGKIYSSVNNKILNRVGIVDCIASRNFHATLMDGRIQNFEALVRPKTGDDIELIIGGLAIQQIILREYSYDNLPAHIEEMIESVHRSARNQGKTSN